MGDHGIEGRPFNFPAVLLKHQQVKFQVLRDFNFTLILQQVAKLLHDGFCLLLIRRTRDIEGASFFKRKSQTDQLGSQGIQAVSFGIKTESFLLLQLLNQGFSFLRSIGQLVVMLHLGDVLQVYRLLGLVKKFGPAPVEQACVRALACEVVDVGLIARIVARAAETDPPTPARTVIAAANRFARDEAEFAVVREVGR